MLPLANFRSIRRQVLAAALSIGIASQASALSNAFTYQGNLQEGVVAANGNYDFQFVLQTAAGAPVGVPLLRDDVLVNQGIFTVEIDFGSAITSADFQLQISVRPGASTGVFTSLTPTTKITPTPQAQIAGFALEASTVSPGVIGAAQINTSQVQSRNATISGGEAHLASGFQSTIGGGILNVASGSDATVSGGSNNTASGASSSVSGGDSNSAEGVQSTVSGGSSNAALGLRSTVSGGLANCAGGDASWAGGVGATVRAGNEALDAQCQFGANSGDANDDEGSFVWAGGGAISSNGPSQFVVRANGGVYFGNATLAVNVPAGRFINTNSGAHLTTGGVWTNASSRTLKQDFAPVNPLEILNKFNQLAITTWRYKSSREGDHIGPMAEDFKATFGFAGDGKSIGTVDADGVALAAIQGLNAKLELLSQENAALRQRLNVLEAR